MLLVIEHDNGTSGQHGFSEEIVSNKEACVDVIKSYEGAGIFIYNISFVQI